MIKKEGLHLQTPPVVCKMAMYEDQIKAAFD